MKAESPLHPVIVCRHGETEANRDGLILGQDDFPLLEEGKMVVRRLGLAIAHISEKWGDGMIFSSPLGRAVGTARIFAEILDWPVRSRESLKELSAGVLSGRKRDDVIRGRFWIRQTWVERPPEGESYEDGEARLRDLEKEIRRSLLDRPMLIVGHGGINRALLKRLLRLSPEEAMKIPVPHGTAYILRGKKVERLDENGSRRAGLTDLSTSAP
ncbi:MAG: histidine phosphatase family protein [Desulfobacteraceae bacterium]|nr:MAG: histidine phosphatase family protein [Desulfobacteraceae bacterium]